MPTTTMTWMTIFRLKYRQWLYIIHFLIIHLSISIRRYISECFGLICQNCSMYGTPEIQPLQQDQLGGATEEARNMVRSWNSLEDNKGKTWQQEPEYFALFYRGAHKTTTRTLWNNARYTLLELVVWQTRLDNNMISFVVPLTKSLFY